MSTYDSLIRCVVSATNVTDQMQAEEVLSDYIEESGLVPVSVGKTRLLDSIDWDGVMVQPRYAGGHHEVMENMFSGHELVGTYYEDDYQGSLAVAWMHSDGTVYVIVDSFGSCSGCDSWEDATDEEARGMIRSIATSALMFQSIDEAKEFNFSEHYLWRPAQCIEWKM